MSFDSFFDTAWRVIKQVSREDYPDLREDEGAVSLFSGGGGDSEGARMAGLPTFYAADGWDTALDVHRANHPEAVHDQVWFGDPETGGGIEEMVQRVQDVVDERKWHLHGSPPCTHISAAARANNYGRRVDEGLEPTSWYLDFVNRVLSGDNPPLSASEFGVPQVRRRLFIGENWGARPTHRRSRSILDVLPHLRDEEKNIMESGHKPSSLDELIERQQITRDVRDRMLSAPHINMTGAVHVGSGGSPWNKEKKGYSWKHTWPMHRTVPSIMASNPPTHAWNRLLTPTETGLITGFPKEYDWSPAVGKIYDTRTPEGGGTTSLAPQAIIGNAVSPLVARSRYANIIPTQKSLGDWL